MAVNISKFWRNFLTPQHHTIEFYDNSLLNQIIDSINNDVTGGIALKILTEVTNLDPIELVKIYDKCRLELQKKWCSLVIGMRGESLFYGMRDKIKAISPERYSTIKDLWTYSGSSVDQYRSGAIEFLRKQTI